MKAVAINLTIVPVFSLNPFQKEKGNFSVAFLSEIVRAKSPRRESHDKTCVVTALSRPACTYTPVEKSLIFNSRYTVYYVSCIYVFYGI